MAKYVMYYLLCSHYICTRAQTYTNTHIHTRTHTDTYKKTREQRSDHAHTPIRHQTDRHTHTHTHMETDRRIHRHTHTRTQINKQIHIQNSMFIFIYIYGESRFRVFSLPDRTLLLLSSTEYMLFRNVQKIVLPRGS